MQMNLVNQSTSKRRPMLSAWVRASLLCGLCIVLASCAGELKTSAVAETTTQLQVDVPNLHMPRAGLLTGGQPSAAAWRDLRASGVSRVVNLLPASELGSRDEAGEVEASGMDYVQIAVSGPDDLTPENAALLWQSMQDDSGSVLVHCASGNRVGALLALAAQQVGGMSPRAALEFGHAAGLTQLEPIVRERLQLPTLAADSSLCTAAAQNC